MESNFENINPQPLDDTTIAKDLKLIEIAAKEAGKIALSFWNQKNEVWQKSGNSPVSQADFAVDKYLREQLLAKNPDYGWLSEETDDSVDRLEKSTLFVVDPIDGTRGFLAGSKQWCISIALVHNNRPVIGVLECPALQETYLAVAGKGCFLNGNEITIKDSMKVNTITGSRKLNAELLEHDDLDMDVLDFVPSLAYRLAMVANNQVDAAIARPGAHDWDLAAADVILHEAGGCLTDLQNNVRNYNQTQISAGSLISASPKRHSEILRVAKTLGILH